MKNECTFIGRLTRDVELKYTSGGTYVATIGLAVNKKWKSKDGELKEDVQYPNFEAWGKDAENLAQLVCKGSLVEMVGEYQLQERAVEGEKKFYPKFRLLRFLVLGGYKEKTDKPEDEFDDTPAPRATKKETKSTPKKGRPVQNDEDDDDVPF